MSLFELERNRDIAIDILNGVKTKEVGRKHGLTNVRVVQICHSMCKKYSPLMYKRLEIPFRGGVTALRDMQENKDLFIAPIIEGVKKKTDASEPKPQSDTLLRLIGRYVRREKDGILKYGTSMDRSDLSAAAWAAHLHDELMDASLYLERVRYALVLLEQAKPIIEALVSDITTRSIETPRAQNWLQDYRQHFGGE